MMATEQLAALILQAQLRKAEHEEAKAAAERRTAELIEQHTIEHLARAARKGGGT